MRLPRFRIRTLMIGVAVVAITTGATVIERRRVRLGEIANYHDGMIRHLRSLGANSIRPPPRHGSIPKTPELPRSNGAEIPARGFASLAPRAAGLAAALMIATSP
jgi:hypothetical protein